MGESVDARRPLGALENAPRGTAVGTAGHADTKRSGAMMSKGPASPSPLRKSPRRKKARTSLENDQAVSNATPPESPNQKSDDMVEFTPDSDASGPALRFAEDKALDVSAASTPSMSQVELNTRRNSLRPHSSESKSGQSTVHCIQEDEQDESDRTISLDMFKNMLAEEADERLAEPSQRNFDSAGKDPRRNTASPSALRALMAMCDDDDDETERERLEEAARKAREEAAQFAKRNESLFKSPEKNAEESPVASRTRFSAKKDPLIVNDAIATDKHPTNMSRPTPLKSCISARKSHTNTGKDKKKVVVFGSPDAAEFDHEDPVKGGVTPLHKSYARSRYLMDERPPETEEGKLIEEDRDTALNSSILATWEEEEEDEEDEDGMGDGAASSTSSSGRGRRRSKGSRKSTSGKNDRRRSNIGRVEDSEMSKGETLQEKFDAVATEDGQDSKFQKQKTPPPSPFTAEQLVQQGKSVVLKKDSSALSPSEAAQGDTIDLADLQEIMSQEGLERRVLPKDETLELQDLMQVAEEEELMERKQPTSPNIDVVDAVKDEEETTVELGSLQDLANLSPRVPKNASAPIIEEEERTMELGSLGQLASFSASKLPVKDAQEEEQTVELGTLAHLGSFKSPMSDQKDETGQLGQVEEETVELGSLSQLASFDGKDSEKKESYDKMRLSFSSETSGSSSNRQSTSSGSLIQPAFNTTAALDNFINSSESEGEEEEEEKETDKKHQGHKRRQSCETGSVRDLDGDEEMQNCGAFSPEKDLALGEIDGFEAKRALPRTPVEGASPDRMEEGEEFIEENGPASTYVPLTSFLAQCQSVDIDSSNLEEFLECQSFDEADAVPECEMCGIDPRSLRSAGLEKATVLRAEDLATKWMGNELKNRIRVAQHTCEELLQGLEEQKPEFLLHKDGIVDERLKEVVLALQEEAKAEASTSATELKRKRLQLCTQVLNEHLTILKDDAEILEEGIENLMQANQRTAEAISQQKEVLALGRDLAEQREVMHSYASEVEKLLETEEVLAKDLKTAEERLEVQRKRLEEAISTRDGRIAHQTALQSLQGQDAILDVAQGLHCFRISDISPSTILLDLESLGENSNSIIVGFAADPPAIDCFSMRTVSRESARHESWNKEVMDEVEQDNISSMENELGIIFDKLLAMRVAEVSSQILGGEPTKLQQALQNIDIFHGRLQELLEEILQIAQEESYPCRVQLDNSGKILFSAELLYSSLGAVIKAQFLISQGYPHTPECCQVQLSVVSDEDHDDFTKTLLEAADAKTRQSSFTPLSDAWKAMVEML